MKEAMLWNPCGDNAVKCGLCSHFCAIRDGGTGNCKVRANKDGRLFSLMYGRVIAQHADPIEKKPFFHFLPGTLSYSIATAGCNFSCSFCQNYQISQFPEDGAFLNAEEVSPENVLNAAVSAGCQSISYTYTEPTVFFEFALDVSKRAKEKGLKNCFVTNGYMSGDALKIVSPWLDAANVDLKGDENFYRKFCKARQSPVVDNIARMRELGIWVEVTTLLVPGENDSEQQIRRLAGIIRDIDPVIPWHISRFFPVYRMTGHYPAPIEKIVKAREIGFQEGLRYVYTGNMPGDNGENTFCHSCGKPVIKRYSYVITENNLRDGKCAFCSFPLDGHAA